MNIIKNIVDESKYEIKCPHSMKPIGITVHNTGNSASAKNEIAYMIRNDNEKSYHFAIDEKEVVQGLPLDRNGWHAGDGGKGKGNRYTIGIEICRSTSKDETLFDRAEANAAEFIAELLKEYGWTIKDVYRHKDWSGKYCPHKTLDRGWDRFIKMIEKHLTGDIPEKVKIKKGDKVKVLKNINYDNGKTFKLWFSEYEVISVKGDRVVIGVNGLVTSAIHIDNVKVIR